MNSTDTDTSNHAGIRWWPSALGIAFGLGVGLGVGAGFASVVMVCALIYVFAAVVGSQGIAWLGYGLSVPLVAVGPILDIEWLSLTIMAGLAVVLFVLGLAKGTWRSLSTSLQLWGILAFGALAFAGLLLDPRIGGILVAIGLFAHAAWDVVHHRRNAVVSRSYAEFCAILDLVLGVLVVAIVASLFGIG